jgi:hypothetical protein
MTELFPTDPPHGSDAWLIDQLRTRPRRNGWPPIMVAAAARLEQLTDQKAPT